eukprot:COSAG06_NODE_6505_length_2903_cov_3.891940_3_plen_63_part_00
MSRACLGKIIVFQCINGAKMPFPAGVSAGAKKKRAKVAVDPAVREAAQLGAKRPPPPPPPPP